MIRVSVEEYCHQCLDFTADVIPPAKIWSEEENDYILGDTIVKCKYGKRCNGIRRFLEHQIKGEASG